MADETRSGGSLPEMAEAIRGAESDRVSKLVDLLSHQRRRYALDSLNTHRTPMAIADVTGDVVRRGMDTYPTIVPDVREQIFVHLYHCHLSKLTDAGVIHLDRNKRFGASARGAEASNRPVTVCVAKTGTSTGRHEFLRNSSSHGVPRFDTLDLHRTRITETVFKLYPKLRQNSLQRIVGVQPSTGASSRRSDLDSMVSRKDLTETELAMLELFDSDSRWCEQCVMRM